MEAPLKMLHIEHVVPKTFGLFTVRKGGFAQQGLRYRSRVHKLDNLQAAHPPCNKAKGNTPNVKKWRHMAMPSLTVADNEGDGEDFTSPYKR